MIIFDGNQFAAEKEQHIAARINQLISQPIHTVTNKPHVAAVLFQEDAGSVLYTQKKSEAAARCGIGYSKHVFSFSDPLEKVVATIQKLNNDPEVTGIIIQKPWRKTWEQSTNPLTTSQQMNYATWWHTLTSSLDEYKDVDGLHPNTLAAIKNNTWREDHRVLPATCKAVLSILDVAFTHNLVIEKRATDNRPLTNLPTAIIGKSDLLGYPLLYELHNRGNTQAQLFGRKELQQRIDEDQGLKDFKVIVSATGQEKLITDQLISTNCILIDVGEPQPDMEFESVKTKAAFLTPVPGGVGPVTITCLLENALELWYHSS